MPLVALSLIREPEPQWAQMGWRFLNVCIGVVIVAIVGLFVFPLSARRITNANYAAGLHNLSALMRQLPLHVSLEKKRNPYLDFLSLFFHLNFLSFG